MKKIGLNSPDFGFKEYATVLKVLHSGNLAQGKYVKAFERKFAELHGGKFAVASNSGTSALFLSLLAINLKPEDEVLVPAFTFGATANAVIMAGAKPIFVDVDLSTYNMDYESAKNKISNRTKAIVVVHLFGNPINLKKFQDLAASHNLILIQDAAQAHLAQWENSPVASYGDITCFSFYPTKNMTTGEGGMCITNNEEMHLKMQILRNQGMESRYKYVSPGLNLRMTEIAAAIGLIQLNKLPRWTQQRIKNAEYLSSHLLCSGPRVEIRAQHVFHQYTIRVDSKVRDQLREYLRACKIQSDVYYPYSLDEYNIYGQNEACPNAQMLSKEVVSIPVHHQLSRRQLKWIVRVLNKFIKKNFLVGKE